MMPEDSGLCTTCFYYKNGKDANWFWSRESDYLFPYNIGRRIMQNHILSDVQFEERANWRRILKRQVQ